MFEIGFPELILIAIVGLLVIGPERLPEALRTLGLWIGRMRRSFTNVKTEIEKEIGMDEIRRQLHNEAVMEEMKRIERDVRDSVRAGEQAGAERKDAAGTDQRIGGAGTAAGGSPPDGAPDRSPDRSPDGSPEGSSDAAPNGSTSESASPSGERAPDAGPDAAESTPRPPAGADEPRHG